MVFLFQKNSRVPVHRRTIFFRGVFQQRSICTADECLDHISLTAALSSTVLTMTLSWHCSRGIGFVIWYLDEEDIYFSHGTLCHRFSKWSSKTNDPWSWKLVLIVSAASDSRFIRTWTSACMADPADDGIERHRRPCHVSSPHRGKYLLSWQHDSRARKQSSELLDAFSQEKIKAPLPWTQLSAHPMRTV